MGGAFFEGVRALEFMCVLGWYIRSTCCFDSCEYWFLTGAHVLCVVSIYCMWCSCIVLFGVHVVCVVSMCWVCCPCAVCGVHVQCVVSMCCVWCPCVVCDAYVL